jgi:hypothetical protein
VDDDRVHGLGERRVPVDPIEELEDRAFVRDRDIGAARPFTAAPTSAFRTGSGT